MEHRVDVTAERFEFGKNWQRFLELVDEDRVESAAASLRRMLGCDDLEGQSFLDVGCGSGLFSLAARRLGASVRSFDLDEQSVACAEELKRRFRAEDDDWRIERGSILDDEYLATLASYDVVYSWGVLHHTGAMWDAIDRATRLVKDDGRLCISIYNDQGGASRRWRAVKRLYNASPGPVQSLIAMLFGVWHELRAACVRLVGSENPLPFADWARKKQDRGMSPWHDMVDWIGGYPFEVAKPEEVFGFCAARGFRLSYLTTQAGGYGCNEFTFVKGPSA